MGHADALARPAVRSLARPGRDAAAAHPGRAGGRHVRGPRVAGHRAVPDGGRRTAVPAGRAGSGRLPRAQRADLRPVARPRRGLVPQPRRGEPAGRRRRPDRLPPAVLPCPHVVGDRGRLGRVPLGADGSARAGGRLRRPLPPDRAGGARPARLPGRVPDRPARPVRRRPRRTPGLDRDPPRTVAAPAGRGRDPRRHDGRRPRDHAPGRGARPRISRNGSTWSHGGRAGCRWPEAGERPAVRGAGAGPGGGGPARSARRRRRPAAHRGS